MRNYALGMLEVQGYSVALASMNEACKGANIKILSMDCNNPSEGENAQIPIVVQVRFEGSISDVENALEIASHEARKYIDDKSILARRISSYSKDMNKILSTGKVKIK